MTAARDILWGGGLGRTLVDYQAPNITMLRWKGDTIVANWPQLEGMKTREIVAKRSGFSCEQTYRRAKQAVKDCISEVVELLDAGEVSVSAGHRPRGYGNGTHRPGAGIGSKWR